MSGFTLTLSRWYYSFLDYWKK